jgi:polysaccharide biosynthesis protein VpsJ
MKEKYLNVYYDTLNSFSKKNYKGYNPYDVLTSPFIEKNISNTSLRLILTQLNKVSPINIRQYIGINPTVSPKAMALVMSSLIRMDFAKHRQQIEYLKEKLISGKSDHFKEYSIGFDFPIQMSHYKLGINDPSVIITLFVLYAFIDYYEISQDEEILSIIKSSYKLISTKLENKESETSLYYSYNFEKLNEIYNATAKIGKFFTLYYKLEGGDDILGRIDKILNYLSKNQREDGSWAYGPNIPYSDSFHTAFILDATIIMNEVIDNPKYRNMLDKGMSNYIKSFIKPSGQPIYIHPVYRNKGKRRYFEFTETDIRDCATCVDLLLKTNNHDLAFKTLDWTINNMYNSNHQYFYFYKEKFWLNRIEHARPQGWMLYSLSRAINN